MEPTAFVVATLSLLATPGPTNTLLATSGAGAGVRRSLPLLAGELGGYLVAILVLRLGVGPFVAAVPVFGVALRVAVALYLLHLAAQLWRHGARQIRGTGPVTLGRVLVTTLLNPKAIIFAFTLLPAEADVAALVPWLSVLGLLIVIAGSAWIAAGSALGRGFRGVVDPRLGYRASAVALAALAGGLSAHALGLA